MALFGGSRDMSLFYHLNKEMIERIMDIQVLLYKLNLNSTDTNLYGEADTKVYDNAVFLHAIINLSPSDATRDDYGVDRNQQIEFAFFRDTLVEADINPEIGDIVEYDGGFWEIDNTSETQYYAGKNPDSWFGGNSFGYSISIICSAHRTRQSQLQLTQIRTGVTPSKKVLPKNV